MLVALGNPCRTEQALSAGLQSTVTTHDTAVFASNLASDLRACNLPPCSTTHWTNFGCNLHDYSLIECALCESFPQVLRTEALCTSCGVVGRSVDNRGKGFTAG